jgi:hypothetical protein
LIKVRTKFRIAPSSARGLRLTSTKENVKLKMDFEEKG